MYICIKETHIYAVYKRVTLKAKNTYRLQLKGRKKTSHANGNEKKVGVAK